MSVRLDRRQAVIAGAAALAAGVVAPPVSGADRGAAGAPEGNASAKVELWPDGVPGAVPAGLRQEFVQRSRDVAISDRILQGVTAPFLEVYRPAGAANGAAILIMPGGGYRYLAWDKEGPDLARWFAAHGVTAAVLAYRLPLDGWPSGVEAPLADAQRAMRLLRHRATDHGFDPARIAAMGFSAGGHLCANLAASFDRVLQPPRDGIDQQSCRPALAAAIYPAIELDGFAPGFFGAATTAAMLERNAPHRHLPADPPPHFLLHAEDDPLVAPEHSLALRAALIARKVPVETHLHATGGHGFGIRLTRGQPVEGWPDRLLAFGRSSGWLPS